MAAIPRSFLSSNRLLLRLLSRTFSSTSTPSSRNTNSPASFDWSDDDDPNNQPTASKTAQPMDPSTLPPPYDPFNKKPPTAQQQPPDPSDLQQVFHHLRTNGLTDYAVKMFDALSKDGLTHQALELFSVIKDKATMPDVVAHTAVLEAYANAGGHAKDAVRTFDRMLASGVSPNAYTYAVLVRGMVRDGRLEDARKYVLEMLGKGMRVNVDTYVCVFEGFLKEGRGEEARGLLQEMKGKGFVADESAVREKLGARGAMFRSTMSLLFGK